MSFRLVPQLVTLNDVNGVMAVILRYFSELVYDVVVKQLPWFQNLLFSERELTFTFAMLSPDRLSSVCLSVACLSVTFVRPIPRRLKFSAIFLHHYVPWPPIDIH